MANTPVYRAFLATSPDQMRAAQSLRHEIYVRTMGIVPTDHPYVVDDRLVDPYDAYSHHLLLTADDVAVGTLRFTLADQGPLEIEECVDLGERVGERAGLCEITRLMVLRDYRCWEATRVLFWGIWKALQALRVDRVLAAGKLGSLNRYYRNFGLSILDTEPFAYPLVPGCRYQLMLGNFGRARSLRRVGWQALFGSSYAGAHLAPTVFENIYRRGLRERTRHGHTPSPAQVRGAA